MKRLKDKPYFLSVHYTESILLPRQAVVKQNMGIFADWRYK